jgi:hypothetical protein
MVAQGGCSRKGAHPGAQRVTEIADIEKIKGGAGCGTAPASKNPL